MKPIFYRNRTAPLEYPETGLPARIHIVPRGELYNAEAGVTQILDDAALESILADLRNQKTTRGGLYFGEEHFIYDPGKSSEAFAWAREFELDTHGIWAVNPEYTDIGAAAIRNKRFKWTSFAAHKADTQELSPGRVRILKIDTVGFTNQAGGKDVLQPVHNRDDAAKKGNMNSIKEKLGLPAEAAEEDILAAISKLQERANAAEAQEKETAELQNRLHALEAEQVDSVLAAHGVTNEKQIARLKPALLPLANRAERVVFLTDLGFTPPATGAPECRMLNRHHLPPPPADTSTPEAQKERALRLRNRAEKLRAEGMTFEAAWRVAESEEQSQKKG